MYWSADMVVAKKRGASWKGDFDAVRDENADTRNLRLDDARNTDIKLQCNSDMGMVRVETQSGVDVVFKQCKFLA